MAESSNKFQSKDFTKHLEGIDIICLQETKGAVKHENYTSYNSNRTDSRSGGVAILVHNHIKKGITRLRIAGSSDITAIKLSKIIYKMMQKCLQARL